MRCVLVQLGFLAGCVAAAALLLLFSAANARAAPFLVADVPADGAIDQCTVQGLPAAVAATSPVKAGSPRTCTWDLAALPAGSYTVTARTRATVWGAESAPSSPFDFARPGTLAPSGTPRLAP